jgi:transposase-like protein
VYPYVWLDATFGKVRQDGHVSMAVVITVGVTAAGDREVLGLGVGPSADGTFWTQFLRGLVSRSLRNTLSHVRKATAAVVSATIRTMFAQPDAASAKEQWRRVADNFRGMFPRVAELMDQAEEDVLAYASFPIEHWRQIWSNNPLERVNKEIKRRKNVVGIFHNPDSIVRLVGSVLSEQHDEWQVTKRYFSAESLAKVTGRLDTIPFPLAAAR